jgi:hypothetical protein
LSENNISEEVCFNILSDFGELLLTSARLINLTKESESYEYVCKFINYILIDFLIDKNNLISNNNSLLTNVFKKNIQDNNRRENFFVLLNNAIKLMGLIIIISENDESITNKVLKDFNNYYLSFQDLFRDFRLI